MKGKSRTVRSYPLTNITLHSETAAVLDHLHRQGLIRHGAESITTASGRKRSQRLFKRYLSECIKTEGIESACALVEIYRAGLVVPVETRDGDITLVLPFADSKPRRAVLAALGGH